MKESMFQQYRERSSRMVKVKNTEERENAC